VARPDHGLFHDGTENLVEVGRLGVLRDRLGDDVHSMRVSQNTACDGWPNISRNGPMVLPGATYGVNFSSDPLPTQASTEAVLKGSVGMYLLGCVRYWDAFGKIHHTKFCQFFSPSDGQFNYCQGSNDAA
jgi:hypothetical protein